MLAEPRSPAAEAYRNLAANLQFSHALRSGPNAGTPLQVVGITSATASDGKSAVVANLAVALAEAGRSVIVVDADLRQPGLHTLFGTSGGEGLTSALLNDGHLPLQDTGIERVRLLASGPPPANPVEALASRRVEQLLARLRAQADFVLVDLAPAAGLADASVLAPRLDGILMVLSAGRTRRDVARRAKEQLVRVDAHVLGVVLTNVRDEDGL
jgi:non-specific protein-tyrosine kinase